MIADHWLELEGARDVRMLIGHFGYHASVIRHAMRCWHIRYLNLKRGTIKSFVEAEETAAHMTLITLYAAQWSAPPLLQVFTIRWSIVDYIPLWAYDTQCAHMSIKA